MIGMNCIAQQDTDSISSKRYALISQLCQFRNIEMVGKFWAKQNRATHSFLNAKVLEPVCVCVCAG